MTSANPKRHTGAAPKRLKIAGSWSDAVARSFKAPSPNDKSPTKRRKAK